MTNQKTCQCIKSKLAGRRYPAGKNLLLLAPTPGVELRKCFHVSIHQYKPIRGSTPKIG